MNRRRAFQPLLLLLTLAAAAGCDSATGPAAARLVGTWEADREDLSPTGSLRSILVFDRDGRFTAEARFYGVYPGESADRLSAWTRHQGRFHVDGNRITFVPEVFTAWDSFYNNPAPDVLDPSPYTVIYDNATFALRGRRLELHYFTAPLHVPEPTSKRFWRR